MVQMVFVTRSSVQVTGRILHAQHLEAPADAQGLNEAARLAIGVRREVWKDCRRVTRPGET